MFKLYTTCITIDSTILSFQDLYFSTFLLIFPAHSAFCLGFAQHFCAYNNLNLVFISFAMFSVHLCSYFYKGGGGRRLTWNRMILRKASTEELRKMHRC